jgi:hypothetical protein
MFIALKVHGKMGLKLIDASKEYVVNVDFPIAKEEGGHKVHLNPYFKGLDLSSRDQILKHYDPKSYKISTAGGPIYLSKGEAGDCINQKKTLKWRDRGISNFRSCKICDKLSEWDI